LQSRLRLFARAGESLRAASGAGKLGFVAVFGSECAHRAQKRPV